MAITALIKINGVIPPKIKKFKMTRSKLWTDAERTMSGKLSANLVGLFPKISLDFAHTTQSEMQTLIGLFDEEQVTVQFWDEKVGALVQGIYYTNDQEYEVFDMGTGMYDPFTINLIPFDPYSTMTEISA